MSNTIQISRDDLAHIIESLEQAQQWVAGSNNRGHILDSIVLARTTILAADEQPKTGCGGCGKCSKEKQPSTPVERVMKAADRYAFAYSHDNHVEARHKLMLEILTLEKAAEAIVPMPESIINNLFLNMASDARTATFSPKNWFEAGFASAEAAHNFAKTGAV